MHAIYYAHSAAEAILMVDYLEQRGIDARATNLHQSGVFGSVPIDQGDAQPTVWVVNDEDVEKAERLIAEHNQRMEDAMADADGE